MSEAGERPSGREGEEIAVKYLEGRGVRILERNYVYDRGEVDIVADDGGVLVFCEVKLRTSDTFGPPEYAVTPRKQAQVRRVALGYLAEHELADIECRFDVVAIEQRPGRTEVRHLRNAF